MIDHLMRIRPAGKSLPVGRVVDDIASDTAGSDTPGMMAMALVHYPSSINP